MRIKEDFVTNSSSTSFVLRAVCIGKIPHIKTEDITKDLKKKFKPSKYELYSYSDKTRFIMNRDIKYVIWGQNHSEEDEDNKGIMKIEVENVDDMYYDEDDQEVHDTSAIVRMFISSPTLYIEDEGILLNEVVIPNLKKILSLYKEMGYMVDLFYSQTIQEQFGDGWDGGDPMGPYGWTHELYEKESKLGRLIGDKEVLRFSR